LTSYFWLIWEILENGVIQMARKKSLFGALLDMSSKNNETIACMKQQKYIKWLFLWVNDRPEPEATRTLLFLINNWLRNSKSFTLMA
jgi:hypothetical protein